MLPERGRLAALVMALVGSALAAVLLFSPFVAEYIARGRAPAHVVDAWRLTTPSPLDGGQRVATVWAVLVILTTLVTLISVWVGGHLDKDLPLFAAAASSALAVIVGAVVAGEGPLAGGGAWTTTWGLSAWQAAHVLVLIAIAVYGFSATRSPR